MLQWIFPGGGEGVEGNNKQQRAAVSTASFRGCTCPLARPELSEAPHPLSLLRAHRINASAVRNRETTRGEGCGRREQTRHNRNPPPTRDLKLSPGGLPLFGNVCARARFHVLGATAAVRSLTRTARGYCWAHPKNLFSHSGDSDPRSKLSSGSETSSSMLCQVMPCQAVVCHATREIRPRDTR